MPTFRYKAYDIAGKAVAGDIEAVGLNDAKQRLKKAGLYPAQVTEAELRVKGLFPLGGRVATGLVALTTRQLATLLASGSSLAEALSVMAENTANPTLKSVLIKVKESVVEGKSLARSLEDFPDVFSPLYRGLVASGEASGTLDTALLRLSDYLDARARLIRDARAALTYPLLMMIVGAGVVSFLFIFVIPKITRIFEDTEAALPLITVVLIWVTELISSYWHVSLAGAALVVWGFIHYVKKPRGKALKDRLIIKAPWFGALLVEFYISNLARTLGSLLKGGVPLLKSLEITKGVLTNTVFKDLLDEAIVDCTGGAQLSSSLKKQDIIPPVVVHMINVGEKSGNIDEMLLKTADTYEQEFDSNVKRTINLLEPLLILVMGLFVGFLVLAILLPIFQLNQIIG